MGVDLMTPAPDIRAETLGSLQACTLLVARARLVAERDRLPVAEVLASQCARDNKLRHALDTVEGLNLRQTLERIQEEHEDFTRARILASERAEELASFIESVIAAAESVLPDIAGAS